MNRFVIAPRWLAPVAGGQRVLHDHGVVVEAGRIGEIAPLADLRIREPGLPVLDRPDHLLIPGLINSHCHAAMTLLRGLGDDLPLKQWLEQSIWPAEQALVSEDFVYDGALLACRELLLGGTTCFNDMYFFPEATARAARTLGMKCMVGIIVFENPSAYGAGPDDYIARGLALRDRLRDDPGVSFSFAPHAPYTVSDRTFARIATLAAELELPIHIHLHETRDEIARSIAEHGVRPLERLDRLGLVGPDLLAVHAVHLDAGEIARLAEAGASVAHCPHSNLKLASGLAPVPALLDAGVRVTIGTDGAASNNRLDLLSEARTAALLAKGLAADPAAFDSNRVLQALTLDGARALGIDHETGSIESGKAADLVAVDLSQTPPLQDPVSTLIHACGSGAVTDVWVDGSHVVDVRQMLNPVSLTALSGVVGRRSLWHNRLGEFVPGRTRPQV